MNERGYIPMRAVYIYPNPQREACIKMARQLYAQLTDLGASAWISDCCKNLLPDLPSAPPTFADIALVLGGDGTILRCAEEVLDLSIPILGINMGTLGYMSDLSPHELADSLTHILCGDLHVERRAVIAGTVSDGDSHPLLTFRAVNDITLFRGDYSGLTHTAVSINGTYIDTYHADGVLVSTPNGSTAYNFSAGGPIVNPAARNMILTPICCHSLLSRSIVLATEDTVQLTPISGEFPQLAADGMKIKLPENAVVLEVSLSETPFLLARLKASNFYDVLRKKMVPSYD